MTLNPLNPWLFALLLYAATVVGFVLGWCCGAAVKRGSEEVSTWNKSRR